VRLMLGSVLVSDFLLCKLRAFVGDACNGCCTFGVNARVYVAVLREDFLVARFSGEFQRYDKLEKAHQQQMQSYWYMVKMANKNDKRVRQILDHGTLLERLLFRLNQRVRRHLKI
jgi:hypothetical protein